MKKIEIKKYLNFLGMDGIEKMDFKSCEICENKNTKLIKSKISWNNNRYGILPVHCCLNCGFIFQNPRFNKNFYSRYYGKSYGEEVILKKISIKKTIKTQKERGELLYKFLKSYLPKKGSMLDVGSSIGCMMIPFIKKGWKCEGNDPFRSFVEYGKNNLGLPVECLQSEDMQIKKKSKDLIIIMGSLEHVYDSNLVMQKCEKAIKKNGILVLEARGDPIGPIKNFFNQSHHRYFFGNTMELIMRKYGFEPFLTTKYPLTGPSRPGTQFCIGRYKGNKIKKIFKNLIKNGKRETYLDIIYKLKYYDKINKIKK